jgi:hypothetical protein
MSNQKENFREYSVIVSVEKDNNEEYPVVETMLLEDEDVLYNYEWVDDERTILKPKSLVI